MHNALSTTYACYCISNLTRPWRQISRAAFPPLAWQNTFIISVVIAFIIGLVLQSLRFDKQPASYVWAVFILDSTNSASLVFNKVSANGDPN